MSEPDYTWACSNCGWATEPYEEPKHVSAREGHELVVCHHNSSTSEDGFVSDDYWCNEFWPKHIPLPQPWAEFCDHGYRGLCMHCLRAALFDALPLARQ